jgi:hypothetical protein
MSTWDAWVVGDPAGLIAVYGGWQAQQQQARPSQYSGGLLGLASRAFWGKPQAGLVDRRRHLPVAADLCRMSSQLLFAAPPMFTVPDKQGNNPAKTRLDRIVNTPGTHSALLEGAFYAAGLGGVYLRLVWDVDVADHVMLDIVDADRAIPDFRWGHLVGVTFWDKLTAPGGTSEQAVWRHLERHEPGRILHGLYKGTDGKLGAAQPLEDHPDTAGYALLVDAEGAIATGVKGLTAAYVPNARPMPAWRTNAKLCDLGKPDLAGGVEPLMQDIDEAWSSLMRDLRLGKGRLVVPEYMLTNLGAGMGAAFDADQEIFTPLSMPPSDMNVKQISAEQFDIRVEEHLGVINAALREVLRATGYSPLTFGMPDEVAATATEIHSREKDSLQTRGSKIRHWSAALGPLVTTLLQLDALVFHSGATVSEDVDLAWPDGAREPLLVRSQSVQAMALAQAASTETRVRIMQPDLDAADVAKEADLIRAEQGMAVPDPFAAANSPSGA